MTPTSLIFMMSVTTAITRHLHNILNPHATSKESNRQEETNDENGDCHEYPGNRFKSTIAKTLEHTCSGDSNQEPPDHSCIITDQ